MRSLSLVRKELRHNGLLNGLHLLSVVVATAMVTAMLFLFWVNTRTTEAYLAQKREALDAEMARMANDFRVITKEIGFNVVVIPEALELSQIALCGDDPCFMPESYVDTLSNSQTMTVRHLLPGLYRQVRWAERGIDVIVAGIRGEVPLMHRMPKEPMMNPVAAGSAAVGAELCALYDLDSGQVIGVNGQRFQIERCLPRRGDKDDITIWIPLDEAQRIFKKPGMINAIHALECRCHADSTLANIARIRKDVARSLPKARVIEFMSPALTRAEARFAAGEEALAVLAAEEQAHEEIRSTFFAMIVAGVPVVAAMTATVLALLAILGVRHRRYEYALLRNYGASRALLGKLTVAKMAILGIGGGLIGVASGLGIVLILAEADACRAVLLSPSGVVALLSVIIGALIIHILASQATIRRIASIDPSILLKEE